MLRQNGWNTIGILYNYRVNYHTDVSVFDANYGATGWLGLTTLETVDFDWSCFCWDHVSHAHAVYNSYYPLTGGYGGGVQGVFCHEVGHSWGFNHGGTDCMAGTSNFYGPHNNGDFYDMYRFHPVS